MVHSCYDKRTSTASARVGRQCRRLRAHPRAHLRPRRTPCPRRWLDPDRQRAFVEALADTGVIREAAGRVGMSEQAVARLRRRPGSGAFVAACEAALAIAVRRVRSVAFERAVNGYTKRHYYHGELMAEEHVFDHRLLMFLLEKPGLAADPRGRVATYDTSWPAMIDAVDDAAVETAAAPDDDDDEVWQEGRRWWTRFPPPAGFRGSQHGDFGDDDYCRTLTKAETAALEARAAGRVTADQHHAARRRDRYFGFTAAPPEV